jgi:hypothetical protein
VDRRVPPRLGHTVGGLSGIEIVASPIVDGGRAYVVPHGNVSGSMTVFMEPGAARRTVQRIRLADVLAEVRANARAQVRAMAAKHGIAEVD